MENYLDWTDEQIEDLINRVYNGVVSKDNLPSDLYEAILDRLEEAIIEGFNGTDFDVNSNSIFKDFDENIKFFAFAKTFQQISDMENFLIGADGNQLSFRDFKKSVSEIFEIYNGVWLETEFNTAKSVSESASQWVDIQNDKDVLPYLKYSTVGDERVRNSHRKLDGVIKKVDDPFWLEYYPPNDFNCRCIVEQLEEGEETEIDTSTIDEVSPLFKNNPAVTGQIFNEANHPYFKGLGERRSL